MYTKEFNLRDEADKLMFSDQTGRFPVTSFKGNQYVMVLFETIGNNILVEAMRNRTSGEMIRAYQVLVDGMKEKRIHPTMHILNNECSAEFKDTIKENKMKYQLVLPNDHRRNMAEKNNPNLQETLRDSALRNRRQFSTAAVVPNTKTS